MSDSLPAWMQDAFQWIGGGALGAGGVWGMLKVIAAARASSVVARIKQPADLLTAMAAFQDAVNDTAEGMLKGLREDVASLRHQNDKLLTRLTEVEEENTECRASNALLRERVAGLEAAWQRSHVTAPGGAEPGSFTVIDGDRVTVMTAGPRESMG